MIKQSNFSNIKSRSECIPYLENKMLPLITAPMYSVVNETNYKYFIDNNINVCLPRTCGFDGEPLLMQNKSVFISTSLNDFIKHYVLESKKLNNIECICIDTANGNMKKLHNAIIDAKKIHGSNLVIIAGNVSSLGAFNYLSKTGVDYIRVGIGGGSACTTSSNVGVGQTDLEDLIFKCYNLVREAKQDLKSLNSKIKNTNFHTKENQLFYNNLRSLSNVKIIADGISTYVKQCKTKYGFNDNGYAAINKLLYTGADLVMIGSLFAQCLESASDKYIKVNDTYHKIKQEEAEKEYPSSDIYSRHYGMSTIAAQTQYKPNDKRSSEGNINYLSTRFTLKEWLYGNEKLQDSYPYLNGWVNNLRSAMSYTNSITLDEFKN